MKIVFLSDIFNHHQKPFSDAVYKVTDKEYIFIETKTISDERKRMGWGMQGYPPYVVSKEEFSTFHDKYMELINTADLIITGSAPEKLLCERKKLDKFIFRYGERPLKQKNEWYKFPVRFLRWHWNNPIKKPIYMLCASAYTASDYDRFGLYKNRTYKWGYFPKTKRYDSLLQVMANKKRNSLLWCGRFLDWKHPDDAIQVAQRLKNDGYSFNLNFIGIGELENCIRQMIDEYDLTDCVHLLGSMKPEQVRKHMEKSEIHLFTSDRQEGWGAVLNESMNSACAVVASHAIGSVPFLVNNRENGLVYESGNVDMLYEKVKYLLDNSTERERLGVAAYHTIADEWNAEVAAERLVNLAQCVLNGEKYPDLFKSGPCSKTEIFVDSWLKNGIENETEFV